MAVQKKESTRTGHMAVNILFALALLAILSGCPGAGGSGNALLVQDSAGGSLAREAYEIRAPQGFLPPSVTSGVTNPSTTFSIETCTAVRGATLAARTVPQPQA